MALTYRPYALYTVAIVMSGSEPAVKPLNLTDVRERLGPVFSEAVQHHRPIPIIRGNRDLAMLLGLEEIGRLVESVSFQPEVFKEDRAVSVWLPEFQIYGRGSDLSAAREDLLEEVREYIATYLEEIDSYRSAPNRRAHFAHVIKALVADLSGRLEPVIFEKRARTVTKEVVAATNVR
jgi:hypothetical protein